MTASDARPPTDTGTTGWHQHPDRDDSSRGAGFVHRPEWCTEAERADARPVLVVDPAEARVRDLLEAARECHAAPHFDHANGADIERCPRCWSDLILAALAGQGQP